ncbi:MAG: ATP-binding protein, partial [Brachymonas sp.]|nr:ATP-binding protein [Brachymonas sp.]
SAGNLLRGANRYRPIQRDAADDACVWWENLWRVYDTSPTVQAYKQSKGREWADDDLKALLIMLTRCRSSGGTPDCNGYRNLRPISVQHTPQAKTAFEQDILEALRAGKIVIADLSSGDEDLQRMYSERITWKIFRDGMSRFTSARPNNFIQFYFEEAHNLFPKKEDKDLSQVYNRLAKEGAKLQLGLVYATQEVSSISGNILKATQNWFISHLNNEDEIKELRKYYDFSDFSDSLVRFSQDTDKGFVRVKTYSNAFVVPVQIDKFAARP